MKSHGDEIKKKNENNKTFILIFSFNIVLI